MPLPAKIEKTQEDLDRADQLSDSAVDLIREGLQQSERVRIRVLRLVLEKLEHREIRTMVRDIGYQGFKKILPFL